MLLLCIVYFLLVCLSFFFVSLLLDCRFVVVEAIIFGHLFVSKYIGWGSVLAAHQRYDSRNILRNKLNQSSFSVLFSCVKRFLRCQNVVSRVSFFLFAFLSVFVRWMFFDNEKHGLFINGKWNLCYSIFFRVVLGFVAID